LVLVFPLSVHNKSEYESVELDVKGYFVPRRLNDGSGTAGEATLGFATVRVEWCGLTWIGEGGCLDDAA